jgi:hypothetical protein
MFGSRSSRSVLEDEGLCVRLWQPRDDRVDAGLNATLDLFTIFVPGPTNLRQGSHY